MKWLRQLKSELLFDRFIKRILSSYCVLHSGKIYQHWKEQHAWPIAGKTGFTINPFVFFCWVTMSMPHFSRFCQFRDLKCFLFSKFCKMYRFISAGSPIYTLNKSIYDKIALMIFMTKIRTIGAWKETSDAWSPYPHTLTQMITTAVSKMHVFELSNWVYGRGPTDWKRLL